MKRTTRRISILRRSDTGGPLAGKFMAIKVDGKLDKEALQDGWRYVYTNYGKKCTIVLYGQSPYGMEEHYEVPAGNQDVNLEVCWTGNKYVIKEALSRKLTIHRDSACPKFYLRVNVGHIPLHLLGRSLGAGDSVSFHIDTLEHDLELTPHGFTDGTLKKVTVPAGDADIDVFVTVTKEKQVIIKESIAGSKKAETSGGTSKVEKNFLPGGLSDAKLKNVLNRLLKENGAPLYDNLVKQNKFGPTLLRVEVGTSAVSFNLKVENGFQTVCTLVYSDFAEEAYTNNRRGQLTLSSQEERDSVLQFIRDFVCSYNSIREATLFLCMKGKDIYLEEEYAFNLRQHLLERTEYIYGSSTTYLLKMKLKELLDPENGKIYQWLKHSEFDCVRFGAVDDCIVFEAHFLNSDQPIIEELFYKDINRSTGVDTVNPFDYLETGEKERLLNEILRDFIDSDLCPGVYIEDDEIRLEPGFGYDTSLAGEGPDPVVEPEPIVEAEPFPEEPETPAKPEHPDIFDSLTSRGVWSALYHTFGEGSFVNVVKNIPVTCLVTAERDAVRVVMMMEDEKQLKELGGMEIPTFEYNYSKCTQKQFQESLEMGETITADKLQNNFDVLEHEEDRAELIDYLMMFIEAIPHVIVEGNTFRSRRPGEEIIEIEQTLTAKVMSHKMVQLFELDGEIMDILRRKNIRYCLIGSYNEYLKIIFVDTDDETIHTIRYDFSDLVDADFLEGEGCFSRLTCGYERDALEAYLGKAVCDMPYFRPGITASGEELFWEIYLNKDIVPALDEDFVPPAEEETEVPEIPEVSTEPVIIDDVDFEDFDTPDTASEEPEGPVYTVQSSPTTWAIVAHLNMQFAVGGGLSQFMKAMGFDQVNLKASAAELILEFEKSGVSCSTMQLPYKQFNKGIEGEFETLGDEGDADKLLTILKNSAPYFK